jgi:tRNA(Ile)-lysidine synthase TilS/MesJ
MRNENVSFKRFKTQDDIKYKASSEKVIVALTDTLDDTATKLIEVQTSKGVNDLFWLSPVYKKKNLVYIKPLYLCLDNELRIYARIKNLKFSRDKCLTKRQEKINDFLGKMEKKHPEIKHATVNAFLKVLPILKRD